MIWVFRVAERSMRGEELATHKTSSHPTSSSTLPIRHCLAMTCIKKTAKRNLSAFGV